MPITLKDIYQTVEDRLNSQVTSLDITTPSLDPISGKITADLPAKHTQLQNIIARAAEVSAGIKAIEALEAAALSAAAAAAALSASSATIGSFPLISGVKTHYSGGIGNKLFSSEWGASYSQTWSENLLAQIAKISTTPSSNYVTAMSDVQTQFAEPPRYECNISNYIHHPAGVNNGPIFAYSDYSYGAKPFALMAINNTSGVNKTILANMYFCGTAGTYGAAAIGFFTPNQNNSNRAGITGYTFTNSYNYNGANGGATSGDVSIVVPANTSIILMFITSDYYQTTNSTIRNLQLYSPRTKIFGDAAVVPDYNIMENLRRAMSGASVFTTLPQLWTVTPANNQSSQVAVDTDISKIVNKTFLTSFSFVDDAAAAVGGVSVGNIYFNTTSGSLTVRQA